MRAMQSNRKCLTYKYMPVGDCYAQGPVPTLQRSDGFGRSMCHAFQIFANCFDNADVFIMYNRLCALVLGDTCVSCLGDDCSRCKLRAKMHQQCVLSWSFTVPVVVCLYTVDCACTIVCSVPCDLPYVQVCTVQ